MTGDFAFGFVAGFFAAWAVGFVVGWLRQVPEFDDESEIWGDYPNPASRPSETR